MRSRKFDLDIAISVWRRGLQHRRAILPEDLDELERHFRDQVSALVGQGIDKEEAYRATLREMGDDGDAEAEYKKVYWGKLKSRRRRLDELRYRMSIMAHYLKVALRNLSRQKGYASINVFGLSVGLAFAALVLLYIREESSFDRFHADHGRIYRVIHPSYGQDGGFEGMYPYQPLPLGPALLDAISEVEAAVRFADGRHVVRIGQQGAVAQEEILFADASVFDVFTFPLLQGNPETALRARNSVVLSEEAGRKFFGDRNPLGQSLDIRLGEQFETFTVTGVAKGIPENSSIRFDVLVPFVHLPYTPRDDGNEWQRVMAVTYVRLADGAGREAVEAALVPFRRLHYPWEIEEEAQGRPPVRFQLEPLVDTHFNTSAIGGLASASDRRQLLVLGGLAVFVLAIACINFMTLAVARSSGRAKEIGVRKVVGARRAQLMGQFWGEALLLTLFALGFGLVLAHLFLPAFNVFTEKSLRFDYFGDALTIPALLALMMVTGMVAGCYPALVLSAIKPVETLKGKFRWSGSNTLTKVLVAGQFGLSLFLLVAALVILGQLRFMRSQNPGFQKEHVIVIPSAEAQSVFTQAEDARQRFAAFRNEIGSRGDIAGITAVSRPPVLHLSQAAIQRHLTAGYHRSVAVHAVDSSFMGVMGITVVEGRAFVAGDAIHAVVINEAMARHLGWSDPVGRVIEGTQYSRLFEESRDLTVIGVVQDFQTRPFHFSVQPAILTMRESGDAQIHHRHLLIRVRPDDLPTTLGALRVAWQNAAPEAPFSYSFLEQDLDRQYRSEERWGKIFTYAAGFAILIACLGLLGMVAMTVARRTKEIGIRKVMGARAGGIVWMLCKDFMKLVLIGFLAATPVALYAMKRWLEDFAYRIELGPEIFLLAGGIALLIALATVGYQAVKAALAKPVDSLRYE